jgi:hypothetical protein
MDDITKGLVASALTELFKQLFKLQSNVALAVAVVAGVVTEFAVGISEGTTYGSVQEVAAASLHGLIIGLTIAGLYKIGMRVAARTTGLEE